jgi:hypothetical protein
LTGSGQVLADGDEQALEDRLESYTAEFRPESPHEAVLVAEMALDDVRMARCGKLYYTLCDSYATRAQLCWDQDRRLEAEDLAARLRRDPARNARKLRGTRQGCELMVERWEALLRILRETGTWTEAQRSLALDLLGVPPELREGDTAVDPPMSKTLVNDGPAFRYQVVKDEIARLNALKDEILDPLDAEDRAVAETSIGAEMTPALQRLHRYESACSRRYHKALSYFLDRDRKRAPAEAPRAPEPRQAPPPAPAPRPAPAPHDYGRLVSAVPSLPVLPADALLDEPRGPNRRERRRLAKLQRQA